MNSNEPSTDTQPIPEQINPVELLKERQRATEAKETQKAAAEEIEREARIKASQQRMAEVPDVIAEILAELPGLYEDLYETDFVHPVDGLLSKAELVDVAPVVEAPDAKTPWYYRIFGVVVPKKRLEPDKIACWQIGWVNMEGIEPFVFTYLAVSDGTFYTEASGQLATPSHEVLLQCSYSEALELLGRIKQSRQRISTTASTSPPWQRWTRATKSCNVKTKHGCVKTATRAPAHSECA